MLLLLYGKYVGMRSDDSRGQRKRMNLLATPNHFDQSNYK